MAEVTIEQLSKQIAALVKTVNEQAGQIAEQADLNAELQKTVNVQAGQIAEQAGLNAELQKQLNQSQADAAKPKEEPKPEIVDTPVKVGNKTVTLLTPFVRIVAHKKLPKDLEKYIGQKLTAKDALANTKIMAYLVAIGSGSIKIEE